MKLPILFRRFVRLSRSLVARLHRPEFRSVVRRFDIKTSSGPIQFDFLISDATSADWYCEGVAVQPYFDELIANLDPASDVIECGSHHGFFTILLAKCLPKGRIVAVEAHPRSCETLRKNLALNGIENVIVVNAAITSSSGVVQLADSSNSYVVTAEDWDQRFRIEVKASTIDEVVELCAIKPQLLKLDIEGEEIQALLGAVATLKLRPKLEIELHLSQIEERYHLPPRQIGERLPENYRWMAQEELDRPLFPIDFQINLAGRRLIHLHGAPSSE